MWVLGNCQKKKKKKKKIRRKDTVEGGPKLGELGSSFTETGDEMREVSKKPVHT
jgi:hypothetical protein